MSQSPTSAGADSQSAYLEAFNQLAMKIRDGESFSGRERNCFFLNTGSLRFADASAVAALDYPDDARGSAMTDWDGDGDLDILLTNRNAPRVRFLRNDCASGHWLAIRLTGDPGKNSPRDAIGARVEVWRGGSRMSRTLHAGDGFLSQEGKTLHFGLGKEEAIEKVIVRWPNGGVETFAGITADAMWHLTQGGGAQMLPTAAPVMLKESVPVLPESTETLRLRLSQPLKLPPLNFTDLNGATQTVESLTERGPLLINLWATWCAPCAAELKDFAALDNVAVLALNVDRLDAKSEITAEQAGAFLQKHGHKGLSGWASQELVAALDRMVRDAVYRHLRLPVPASFLIDRGGWLTLIYKGPAKAETIRADVPLLGIDEELGCRAAVPFQGPWAGRTVFVSHPVAIAAAWRESGFQEESKTVLEAFLKENPAKPGDAKLSIQRGEVLFRLGDLELELESGHPDKALAHFTASLESNGGLIPARIGRLRALAALHRDAELAENVRALAATVAGPDALAILAEHAAQTGRTADAITALREAVAKNPRFVPGLNALAWHLATAADDALRNGAEALKTAEFFLQAPGARDNPEFLLTLAAAQAEQGKLTEAAESVAAAINLARRRGDRLFLRRALPVQEAIKTGKPWRVVK